MPSLFGKRKFTIDEDDHCDFAPVKQVKLTPRATAPIDNDSAMTDAQNLVNVVPFPTFPSYDHSSSRLSINTMSTGLPGVSPNYTLSSLPSSTSSPSMSYPSFELYPEIETPMDVDMEGRPSHHHHTDSTSSTSSDFTPGLLQPTTSLQHTGNCTQIPRLRMSSHAGLNGTRSLWSHCESCGAIEMVMA